MTLAFSAVVDCLLAVILGGGIILAAIVRPRLLRAQRPGAQAAVAATIESVSVGVWHRYNQVALVSTAVVGVVEGAQTLRGADQAPLHLTALVIAAVQALVLALKLVIDRQIIRQNARTPASSMTRGGEDRELDDRHALVEWLTLPVFILTLVLMILPL
jgi:hypothetical protein